MQSRIKNIGMWLSIVAAVATSAGAYIAAPTQDLKVGIVFALVTTVLGIISNPKEGTGYLDK
jgi:F0F1-type ATP synthase membrane subunit a